MSIGRCDETVVSGMVYAIRKGLQKNNPGMHLIVLFKGCTFSCKWCSAPELQSYSPELRILEDRCVRCGSCIDICTYGAAREDESAENEQHYSVNREICIACGACISGCPGHAREMVGICMSVDEVMTYIKPNIAFLTQEGGGVTFTGGEPLLQIGFLEQLLLACRELGIRTEVDTSGYVPWEFIDRIRLFTDLFLFDVKLMDEERHREFTGLSNDLILENLKKLSHLGHHIILRIPIIPGINDDIENLDMLASFASNLPGLVNVVLHPYRSIAGKQVDPLDRPYHMTFDAAKDGKLLNNLLRRFQSSGISAIIAGEEQTEQVM